MPGLYGGIHHELWLHAVVHRVELEVDARANPEVLRHPELEGAAHLGMVVEGVAQHVRVVALVAVVGILAPSPYAQPVRRLVGRLQVKPGGDTRAGVERREETSAEAAAVELPPSVFPGEPGIEEGHAARPGPGILRAVGDYLEALVEPLDVGLVEIQRHRRHFPYHRRIDVEERLVGGGGDTHIHRMLRKGGLRLTDRGELPQLDIHVARASRREGLVGDLGYLQLVRLVLGQGDNLSLLVQYQVEPGLRLRHAHRAYPCYANPRHSSHTRSSSLLYSNVKVGIISRLAKKERGCVKSLNST